MAAANQALFGELNDLAQERSSEKRRELLHRITDLFVASSQMANESEMALFDDVMGRIIDHAETDTKSEVAERLSLEERAPPQLIKTLAHDEEFEVAGPVLENSPCLTNDDLASVARSNGMDHLHAISGRKHVARSVTDIIVERGDERVLTRVTKNHGAEFSDQGFETLYERAQDHESLIDDLRSRADIPEAVLVKIAEETTSTTQTNTSSNTDPAAAYVEKLKANNRLDEASLRDLARQWRSPEVQYALVHLTGLDDAIIRHILTDAPLQTLAVVCKSANFSTNTFLTLVKLKFYPRTLAHGANDQLTQEYENLTEATARRVLRFLKVRANNA